MGDVSFCQPGGGNVTASATLGSTNNFRLSYTRAADQYLKFEGRSVAGGTYAFNKTGANLSYSGRPMGGLHVEGRLPSDEPFMDGHYLDQFVVSATDVPDNFSLSTVDSNVSLYGSDTVGKAEVNLTIVRRSGGGSGASGAAFAVPTFGLNAKDFRAGTLDFRMSPTGTVTYERAGDRNRIQVDYREGPNIGAHLEGLGGLIITLAPAGEAFGLDLKVPVLRVEQGSTFSFTFRSASIVQFAQLAAGGMPENLEGSLYVASDGLLSGDPWTSDSHVTPHGGDLGWICWSVQFSHGPAVGDCHADPVPAEAQALNHAVNAGAVMRVISEARCIGCVLGKRIINIRETDTRFAKLVLENAGNANIWVDADGDTGFPGTPSFFGAEVADGAKIFLEKRFDSTGALWDGRVFQNASSRAGGKPLQLSSTIVGAVENTFKAFAWNRTSQAPVFKALRDGQWFLAPSSTWSRSEG